MFRLYCIHIVSNCRADFIDTECVERAEDQPKYYGEDSHSLGTLGNSQSEYNAQCLVCNASRFMERSCPLQQVAM
jgi:hypothetical protein